MISNSTRSGTALRRARAHAVNGNTLVVAKQRRRRRVGEPARRSASLCSGTTLADGHGGMARPTSLHGWARSVRAGWSVDVMGTQAPITSVVDGDP